MVKPPQSHDHKVYGTPLRVRRLRGLERTADDRALRRRRRSRRVSLAARAALLNRRNCLRPHCRLLFLLLRAALPRRVQRRHSPRRRSKLQAQLARGSAVGGRSAGDGRELEAEAERPCSRYGAVARCVVWRGPADRRMGPLARLRVRMTCRGLLYGYSVTHWETIGSAALDDEVLNV